MLGRSLCARRRLSRRRDPTRLYALGAACAVACSRGDAPPAPAGSVGASIAVIRSGSLVAVVNPDQGSVSLLDPDSLAVRGTVDVGGEPHALLELSDGTILVANYRGGEIVRVDPVAQNGAVTVDVKLDGTLPPGA